MLKRNYRSELYIRFSRKENFYVKFQIKHKKNVVDIEFIHSFWSQNTEKKKKYHIPDAASERV